MIYLYETVDENLLRVSMEERSNGVLVDEIDKTTNWGSMSSRISNYCHTKEIPEPWKGSKFVLPRDQVQVFKEACEHGRAIISTPKLTLLTRWSGSGRCTAKISDIYYKGFKAKLLKKPMNSRDIKSRLHEYHIKADQYDCTKEQFVKSMAGTIERAADEFDFPYSETKIDFKCLNDKIDDTPNIPENCNYFIYELEEFFKVTNAYNQTLVPYKMFTSKHENLLLAIEKVEGSDTWSIDKAKIEEFLTYVNCI